MCSRHETKPDSYVISIFKKHFNHLQGQIYSMFTILPPLNKQDGRFMCSKIAHKSTWELKSFEKKKAQQKEKVIVVSISFYPFNTVIWCSEKANSLKCLSHEMDIWQSMCVTHAIYGISETVFTLYLYYPGRKLEINNLIQEAAGMYESKPDSMALHCENILYPANMCICCILEVFSDRST